MTDDHALTESIENEWVKRGNLLESYNSTCTAVRGHVSVSNS